jgi:hypothetical protein
MSAQTLPMKDSSQLDDSAYYLQINPAPDIAMPCDFRAARRGTRIPRTRSNSDFEIA